MACHPYFRRLICGGDYGDHRRLQANTIASRAWPGGQPGGDITSIPGSRNTIPEKEAQNAITKLSNLHMVSTP